MARRGVSRTSGRGKRQDASGPAGGGRDPAPAEGHIATAAEFRAAVHRAVSPKQFKRLIRAIFKRAKEGDIRAARLLLGLLLGQRI